MKNEKREITLNEKDSLTDMLETEKNVLNAYVDSLWQVEKKQFREQILRNLNETAQDAFLLLDILSGKNSDNG